MRHTHFRSYSTGLIIAGLFFSGCVTYGSPSDSGTATKLNPSAHDFDYTSDRTPPQIGTPKSEGKFTVTEVKFFADADLKNPWIPTRFYQPAISGPRPAVIILPITRGDYPTKAVAAYLANRGIASLLFMSRPAFTGTSRKNFETMAAQFHDYVVEVRQSLDWLTNQPSIDSDRIGLVGMSLGAIVGSLTAGVDPRIRSEVLLLGGGDLPGIIFSTREKSYVKMRNRLMEERKATPETLKQEAEKTLAAVEPLNYANRLPPSNILMINAYFDKSIPRPYTMALWEKIGKPHLIFVPTGHYTAALFLWYAESKTYQHLKTTLGMAGTK
jgi:dienelactone hydrolase